YHAGLRLWHFYQWNLIQLDTIFGWVHQIDKHNVNLTQLNLMRLVQPNQLPQRTICVFHLTNEPFLSNIIRLETTAGQQHISLIKMGPERL
ncbi:MAG: hypothetical protein OEZ29_07940, partial [Candidatus Bathyarchaeota archaeon]|nr:hypothetical protein [Candidatus Bathyarchaeota archaeon]